MIASRVIPDEYQQWNRQWHAPYGRRGNALRWLKRIGLANSALGVRFRGPFGFQPNNTIRRFEFPWAYFQVSRLGRTLNIVEIGGGLSGLQFVLAKDGHRVTNIDPGLAAKGVGWNIDNNLHRQLCRSLNAPVCLCDTTIQHATIESHSIDVALCVSVMEHLTDEEQSEVACQLKRILKDNGVLVMTLDLFLDTTPFTRRPANQWGRNMDVRQFLNECELELIQGKSKELFGFPEFCVEEVLSNLSEYLVGERYPCLTQCLTAGRIKR